MPLHSESGHPAFVHLWPTSQPARYARNSCLYVDFANSIDKFALVLLKHGFHLSIVRSVLQSKSKFRQLQCTLPKRQASAKVVILSLPYHPVWTTARIPAILRSNLELFSSHLSFLSFKFDFRVSWRKNGANLGTMLRTTCS